MKTLIISILFLLVIAPVISIANTATYKDPFEFCKAVRNKDSIEGMEDKRYVGPDFPSAVIKALGVEVVTWRCMDGNVYGCIVGASGRACMQWENVTLSPTASIKDFCVHNPNSYVSNADNDTPYNWDCHGTVAVIDPDYKKTLLDKRGYVIDAWKKIIQGTTVVKKKGVYGRKDLLELEHE